jgi:hypothetical protein
VLGDLVMAVTQAVLPEVQCSIPNSPN